MVSWRHDQTVVRRLRVKGRRLDSLAAQLRLDSLLQTVDLHPSWLRPSAIVCVRRFDDPMPGALKFHRHNSTRTAEWQRAVSTAIENRIRTATRPINMAVSSETAAVIFKDQAELLACLALDWSADRLGSRWWWQSLFKGRPVTSIVPDAWLNAPEYVPAAVELLSVKLRIKQFARTLSNDVAGALLREVTRTFALQELHAAIEAGFAKVSPLPVDNEVSPAQSHAPSLIPPAIKVPLPPWWHFAPESLDQVAGFERQCLFGVALTIRRAPAEASSFRFAHATLRWLRAAGANEIAGPRTLGESQRSPRVLLEDGLPINVYPESPIVKSKITQLPLNEPTNPKSLSPQTPSSRVSAHAVKKESPNDQPEYPSVSEESRTYCSPAGLNANVESQSARLPGPGSQLTVSGASSARSREPLAPVLETLIESAGEAAIRTSGEIFSASGAENDLGETALSAEDVNEVRVETELGGIFYLVNLALFLDLYGDFTMPAQSGLTLSIFDFLALAGQRLIGSRILDDPVWGLLAEMAGRRDGDELGEGFEPADKWRLPLPWLQAFPEECRLEWTTADKRLRVKHPAGFLLIDVPLSDDPVKQLKREMKVYNAGAKWRLSHKAISFSPHDNRLGQWLDWLMPYLAARLCRALGTSDVADLARTLCAQRASILLTAVHLDIFFMLTEHPLEIRVAGLDRDPGWVPAAGRFVRFHYQ